MEPLTELPSSDDLTSNDVESWLETSSKYHSCELVDTDWCWFHKGGEDDEYEGKWSCLE